MSTFTPGPWVCAEYAPLNAIATVAHVGEWQVGIPTTGYPGGNYRDAEYGDDASDARLIAAAPTLLQACRWAIVALKGREHDGFLRDAIKEATGETP